MAYVCKKCEGDDVEVKEWINPNTGRGGQNDNIDTDTTWCKDCQDEDLGIVWKDEFEENEIDQDSINDDQPGEDNQ